MRSELAIGLNTHLVEALVDVRIEVRSIVKVVCPGGSQGAHDLYLALALAMTWRRVRMGVNYMVFLQL